MSANERQGESSTMTNDWVMDITDLVTLQSATAQSLEQWSKEKLGLFLEFRLNFLQEELTETRNAETADEIVDGIIDLCVVAIGTLIAFGVEPYTAWNRVHKANMAKSPGVNLSRPNPFNLPDLIKPVNWVAPTHIDNVGLLNKLFGE